LATLRLRKFVRAHSETKLFATLANSLAGRACMPADKEQTNENCNDPVLSSEDMFKVGSF
jgi:hypothetical protein